MDSLLVLMGIHILNMFKDSAELLLSFMKIRARMAKRGEFLHALFWPIQNDWPPGCCWATTTKS